MRPFTVLDAIDRALAAWPLTPAQTVCAAVSLAGAASFYAAAFKGSPRLAVNGLALTALAGIGFAAFSGTR